jgi:predicted negative regulator of RcsB-dependent stress response
MIRHPTARRVHQQSTPDDALTERLLHLVLWGKKNVRTLSIAAVVVVLAVLTMTYSANMREARQVEASRQLNEVRQTALSGNHALAIRDIEAFIARFSGTTSADEARLLMAQVSLEDAQPEKAIEALQPLARKADTPLGTPAALLLAAAYEQSGNTAQAEATYLRIAEQAPMAFQRREAIEQAARIREGEGDLAEAVRLYQRLIEMTQENSGERSIAELRLAEARARTAQ